MAGPPVRTAPTLGRSHRRLSPVAASRPTAEGMWGPPTESEQPAMLVTTMLGAAVQVSGELPTSVRSHAGRGGGADPRDRAAALAWCPPPAHRRPSAHRVSATRVLGGLIGASAGLLAVVGTAVARDWGPRRRGRHGARCAPRPPDHRVGGWAFADPRPRCTRVKNSPKPQRFFLSFQALEVCHIADQIAGAVHGEDEHLPYGCSRRTDGARPGIAVHALAVCTSAGLCRELRVRSIVLEWSGYFPNERSEDD